MAGSLHLSDGDARCIDHRSEIDVDDACPLPWIIRKQVLATNAGIVKGDVKCSEVFHRGREGLGQVCGFCDVATVVDGRATLPDN